VDKQSGAAKRNGYITCKLPFNTLISVTALVALSPMVVTTYDAL